LLWGWQRLDSSRDLARRAARELAECERLAARIGQLSDRPSRGAEAGAAAAAETELARLIEQLAPQCAMPADAVVRIVPEAARRADEREDKWERTAVVLH